MIDGLVVEPTRYVGWLCWSTKWRHATDGGEVITWGSASFASRTARTQIARMIAPLLTDDYSVRKIIVAERWDDYPHGRRDGKGILCRKVDGNYYPVEVITVYSRDIETDLSACAHNYIIDDIALRLEEEQVSAHLRKRSETFV